jgi:hypothetical protein
MFTQLTRIQGKSEAGFHLNLQLRSIVQFATKGIKYR